jgi:hypothetical protein
VWRRREIARPGDIHDAVLPAVPVRRTKTNLERDRIEHWLLGSCHRGGTVLFLRTDKSELKLPAGVPFLWSLEKPRKVSALQWSASNPSSPVTHFEIWDPLSTRRGVPF